MPLYGPSSSSAASIPGSAATSWEPTGAVLETAPRSYGRFTENVSLTSGTLLLVGGGYLPAGATVTNITFFAITGATTPTNQWFCLVDQARNVLGKTADDTSTAWGSSAVKTLALTTPYTASAGIAVYLGIMVAAAATPVLAGFTLNTSVTGITPKLVGTSNTGLTVPSGLGSTANAITATGLLAYGYAT